MKDMRDQQDMRDQFVSKLDNLTKKEVMDRNDFISLYEGRHHILAHKNLGTITSDLQAYKEVCERAASLGYEDFEIPSVGKVNRKAKVSMLITWADRQIETIQNSKIIEPEVSKPQVSRAGRVGIGSVAGLFAGAAVGGLLGVGAFFALKIPEVSGFIQGLVGGVPAGLEFIGIVVGVTAGLGLVVGLIAGAASQPSANTQVPPVSHVSQKPCRSKNLAAKGKGNSMTQPLLGSKSNLKGPTTDSVDDDKPPRP